MKGTRTGPPAIIAIHRRATPLPALLTARSLSPCLNHAYPQTCWYAWTELSQIYAIGVTMYFKSYWNAFDATMISLVLTIPPLHVVRVSDDAGEALGPLVAFGMILVSSTPTPNAAACPMQP